MSSVPSWIRLGTGVKVLKHTLESSHITKYRLQNHSRCSFVGGQVVVGLVGTRSDFILLCALCHRALEAPRDKRSTQSRSSCAPQNSRDTLRPKRSHSDASSLQLLTDFGDGLKYDGTARKSKVEASS